MFPVMCQSCAAIPTVYAPVPKNTAAPSEMYPVNPENRFQATVAATNSIVSTPTRVATWSVMTSGKMMAISRSRTAAIPPRVSRDRRAPPARQRRAPAGWPISWLIALAPHGARTGPAAGT